MATDGAVIASTVMAEEAITAASAASPTVADDPAADRARTAVPLSTAETPMLVALVLALLMAPRTVAVKPTAVVVDRTVAAADMPVAENISSHSM